MIERFAQVVREQIKRDIANLSDDMTSGACRSYDEYQKLCGIIQGLVRADSYVTALLEKVEHDDE